MDRRQRDVDELIELINRKLKGNQPVLAQSLEYGRIQWRRDKNGQFKVKIEANI